MNEINEILKFFSYCYESSKFKTKRDGIFCNFVELHNAMTKQFTKYVTLFYILWIIPNINVLPNILKVLTKTFNKIEKYNIESWKLVKKLQEWISLSKLSATSYLIKKKKNTWYLIQYVHKALWYVFESMN